MVRQYATESIIALLLRAFGLIPIILISRLSADPSLIEALYAWGTVILLHAAIVVPAVNLHVMQKLRWEHPTFTTMGIVLLVCALACLSLEAVVAWAAPLFWLGIAAINGTADYYALINSRTLSYQFFQSLKNFGLIAALVFWPESNALVFWGAAVGEAIKLTLFMWVSRRARGQSAAVMGSASLIQLAGYSSKLALVLLLVFIERSTIVQLDPPALVTYDLLYRFLEVPLTIVTSGALPIYIARYSQDRGTHVQDLAWWSSLVISTIGVLIVVPASGYLLELLDVRSNQKGLGFVLFALLASVPALTALSFVRREVAAQLWRPYVYLYLLLAVARCTVGAVVLLAGIQEYVLLAVTVSSLLMLYAELGILRRASLSTLRTTPGDRQ